MANIQMDKDVLTAIYESALEMLPMAVQLLKMLQKKKRSNDHSNVQQKAFDKYCRQNRNIITPENKQAILKEATQKVLNQKFGLPAVDLNAYHLRVRRNKITLSFDPKKSEAIPLAFWANKMQMGEKPVSEISDEPKRMNLTSEEVEKKLTENEKWASQKETYKERLREMFAPTEEQLKEVFKDGLPKNLDLSNCKISNFDFSKYDLRGANFQGAELKNCVFHDLSHADLSGADISGCNFCRADLRYTTFEGAKIQNCNISNAQLEYASFRDARPSGMDLSGSRTNHTNMDWQQAENVIFDTLVDVGVADEILDKIDHNREGDRPYNDVYLPQRTLNDVLEQHQRWMATDGREGQRADLRGARLQNVDVSGKDLTGVRVNQHDLSNVKYDKKTKWPENIVAPHEVKNQIRAVPTPQKGHNIDVEADDVPLKTPGRAPAAQHTPQQTPIAPAHQMMP